jgi:hypothetical protein
MRYAGQVYQIPVILPVEVVKLGTFADAIRVRFSATYEASYGLEERESTIVVGPGGRVSVDEHLNVVIEVPEPGAVADAGR